MNSQIKKKDHPTIIWYKSLPNSSASELFCLINFFDISWVQYWLIKYVYFRWCKTFFILALSKSDAFSDDLSNKQCMFSLNVCFYLLKSVTFNDNLCNK